MDVASETSERSTRAPSTFLPADDTLSLTSFPDPAESAPSVQSTSPPPVNEPLNGLLDGAGPSMFDEQDDNVGNPQTLATAPADVIHRIIHHRGAVDLVRRLSSLLAERDAHVSALIRLAEEYKIPAEQISIAGTRAKQAELRRISLAAAGEDTAPSITSERSASPLRSEASSSKNYSTVRGLTRLCGGTGKRRESVQITAETPAPGQSAASSRSASRVATVRARPKSLDVRSITSNESGGSWATALFGGGGGTIKGNGTVKRRGSRPPREPVEMSTRHDRDQLPPTLLQSNNNDPQESEWNKYILKLSKSREQAGEEAGAGELIGASRFGTEGSVGKQKLDQMTRLVVHGIPMQLRHSIWMELSNTYAIVQPDGYKHYLETSDDSSSTEIDAILKDVPRTLTSKYDFYAEKGYDRLKRVLIAFVNRYPGLGYTQGLNMIAGYLLLAIPDESDAFWLLCQMVDEFFPVNYFSREEAMQAPIADNVVLRGYVRELLPRLSEHLTQLDVAPAHTVPLSWFLTAYASVLPETALLRIWDVWLCLPQQKSFLLNVALTLLATHAKSLLECTSQGEYFDYMTHHCRIGESVEEVNALIRQAFLMRKKFDQVEVRRALEMKKLRKHPSTDGLFTPESENPPELREE